MEFLIPIFRLVHFFGLAMLLGATLCSMVLVRKEAPSVLSAKLAWDCMHMVAAPGLMILLITGILQSSAVQFEHFKGAGYMHAKIVLLIALLAVMIFDMRVQKKIIKTNPDPDSLTDMIKKRQAYALGIVALTFFIMWLVSFRPF